MYDLYMVYKWPCVHICQVTLLGFLGMLTLGWELTVEEDVHEAIRIYSCIKASQVATLA